MLARVRHNLLAQHLAGGLAEQPLGRIAEPLGVVAIVEAEALLVVEVADQHRQGVGDHLQFRFALAQRIFAGLLAADVHHRAESAAGGPARRSDSGRAPVAQRVSPLGSCSR